MCVQIINKEKPFDFRADLKISAAGKNNWIPAGTIFDTGAEVSSISEELRAYLGARIIDTQYMKGTNGADWNNVCYLDLELYEDCILRNRRFTSTTHDIGCHVIIGMDIISLGDFHSFRDSDGFYKCTFRVYENE